MARRRAYADEYAVRVNRAVELLVDLSPADSVRALAGRARLVGAPSASVCERGVGPAGGGGRARADGGVHGPVGAVVDRWAARAGGFERPDAERGDGGGGQRVSRSRPRATPWQGALRSSLWVTGSPARGSRRRTRSWRPSGAV